MKHVLPLPFVKVVLETENLQLIQECVAVQLKLMKPELNFVLLVITNVELVLT